MRITCTLVMLIGLTAVAGCRRHVRTRTVVTPPPRSTASVVVRPRIYTYRYYPGAQIYFRNGQYYWKTGAVWPCPHQLMRGMRMTDDSTPPATMTVATRMPRM